MPWTERKPMDEKVLLIADYLRDSADFTTLCRRYGVSRKTGYKWVARYRDQGLPGLDERSRRPKVIPPQMPWVVRQAIIELRGCGTIELGSKKFRRCCSSASRASPFPAARQSTRLSSRPDGRYRDHGGGASHPPSAGL